MNVNPSTVLVLQCGTPVELPFISQTPTILQAWYGGQELGNAIADVLFGDVTPSGWKWYEALQIEPEFPFGYVALWIF